MSRRESRVSMHDRQNDALFEFENFKKKFLLANKHITKLNSTLSVRIEELNAQISALHVENLRLRASEIALGTQLKKEREKSQRILTDAESAIHSLMKSFGSMRKNFNIPSPKSQSPKKDPPPKARRPVLNPAASPHANRLARPPRFPEIFEEDEGAGSDVLEDDRCQSPTPVTRRKKPRSTTSSVHTHVLARQSSPTPPLLQAPIVATIQVDIDESLLKQGKKRISRRQSGLITVGSGNSSSGSTTSSSAKSRATSPPPRAPSPAFGSPLRRDAGLAEEEEEYAAVHGHRRVDADEDVELERASNRGKKKRTLAQAQAEEAPAEEGGREREKRRIREDFEVAAQRLQDVTNAFVTRASLPPLDTNVFEQDRRTPPEDTDSDMPSSALTYASTRPPLSTAATTPAPSHLPTPRNSSPPPIPLPGADADASTMGRERRVRKSVNYAEPKLNTKMRKPDPVTQVKRTSSGGSDETVRPTPAADTIIPMVTERRRKSRPRLPIDDDEESDGAQADEEPLAGSRGMQRTGLSNIDTRRRSAVVNASRRSLIEDDEGRRHSMLV
ncbi:hypothetical protein EI94DRAFT_1779516 [Lactarius quietus]|nr:hypothetical protein EI94DRAFT_1779516 [Lactarius quietus]